MHDCISDPRPFAAVLRDWMVAINGGRVYGARRVAAFELCESKHNIRHWLDGRPCSYERPLRKLMTLIAGVENKELTGTSDQLPPASDTDAVGRRTQTETVRN